MPALIEDYGLVGDLQSTALVSRHGCVDWLCLPRFDSGAVFAALLGTPENGHWTLQPAGEFRSTGRRYRGDTLVLETELETPSGAIRLVDFMPPRETNPDLVRIVEGVRGRVEMRMELVIRFDYGSIVPWVRNARRHARRDRRARRDVASHTGGARGAELPNARVVLGRGGRPGAVRPHLVPVQRADARAGGRRGGAGRHGHVLGGVGGRVHVPRAVGRRGPALAADAEGADVRPDGRDRRRSHDVAPGGDRRRPQLGLPLLLAARRDADAARIRSRGLPERGRGLARLAAPRDRGLAGGPPDHVRRRRRAPTPRARAAVARRLRGLASRCGWATPRATSSSSTCTARSSTPCTTRGGRAWRRPRTRGRSHGRRSTGSSRGGARRTRASGRCAGRAVTSRTRR